MLNQWTNTHRNRLVYRSGVWIALAGSIAAACSGEDSPSPTANGGGDGDATTSPSDPDLGDGDSNQNEQELEASFRAPVVSGPYLWTANPDSDRVARIHGITLAVELFESGHGPTFLAALPKGATEGGALVLNEMSQDASIFLLDEEGSVGPIDRLPVQKGASAWAVGAKGKYAIAWSKFGDSSLPGIDGHQDLTVFDFSGDKVKTAMLAVGYRPSEVFINQSESTAYVVADPGISVVSLKDKKVIREIFLPEGNLVGSRDIEFSPDGSLALSRTQGSKDVLLIDTASAVIKTLSLPDVVTDLDMSEDGSLAVAVVRGSAGTSVEPEMGGAGGMGGMGGAGETDTVEAQPSVIVLIDPETVFDAPSYSEVLSDEVIGSVVIAEDGSQVVLYTNANDDTHLSILDPQTLKQRVVDLKAPARAAFLSEDGAFAVALMSPPSGSKKAGAFALVPIHDDLPPRIEGTANQPEFVSLSGKSERALITTSADAEGRAETFFAQFPGLLVDRISLPSRPLATGLVPDADQGFVAQEHPEGRVTFIQLESGQDKTVTGFELAAKVVD